MDRLEKGASLAGPLSALPGSAAGAPRRRLLSVLRLAAGLAILGLVARTLPWSDRLEWTPGGTEGEGVLAVVGEIEGEWTSDRIGFRPAQGEELEAGWPEDLRLAARTGGLLEVRRDVAGGDGTLDWKPGMPRVFREMERGGLTQAFAWFTLALCIVVTRWQRLLALVGCPTSWFGTLRLTLFGLFFNLVVPGLTGGDLVKCVIVARENPGRRADALVSVLVDRVIGLLALAALALVCILAAGDTVSELRLPVLLLLAAAVLGMLVYKSRRLRGLVRFEALVARLPLGEKLRSLDRAALTFGNHPVALALALGLSLLNHTCISMGCAALGRAFGLGDVSTLDYFVVVPIGNIVSSLPLTPGGWGLGEAAYRLLFEMIGADGALGVAVSVTFRLCMLAFGLIGGIFLLLPGQRVRLRELEDGAAG